MNMVKAQRLLDCWTETETERSVTVTVTVAVDCCVSLMCPCVLLLCWLQEELDWFTILSVTNKCYNCIVVSVIFLYLNISAINYNWLLVKTEQSMGNSVFLYVCFANIKAALCNIHIWLLTVYFHRFYLTECLWTGKPVTENWTIVISIMLHDRENRRWWMFVC